MKKYFIYKTTNIINGKIYIGIHYSDNKNDNYLGSGKTLKKAIKKYGKENFKKEILFIYDNKQDALNKEFEIVNEDFVKSSKNYNMKIGGEGGWDYVNNILTNDILHMKKKYSKVSASLKKKYANGELKGWQINMNSETNGFKGKHHSEKTKRILSKKHNLDPEIVAKRKNDYYLIEKKLGYIGKLSKLWNVSHTQVRRFINRHIE
jgi:hypothetical protein